MKSKLFLSCLLGLVISTTVFAQPANDQKYDALKSTVVLIIRHAEKPPSGFGLTLEGEARARAYVNYFKNYTVDGRPLQLDYLFAAADSTGSHRPRLTIEPTSKALGLKIDQSFKAKDFQGLVDEIRSKPHGHAILIAWHHGDIPSLVHAFGVDPASVIPGAKWPDEQFGWVIQLSYDADGRLIDAKRINENLMPDDSTKTAEK